MRHVRGILTALSENYEIAYYRSVKNPLQLPLKNILLKYAGGKRGRAQRVNSVRERNVYLVSALEQDDGKRLTFFRQIQVIWIQAIF